MLKSNFSFLEEKWPLMASLGSMAEKYLYTDSNTCLIKIGLFAESLVHSMFTLDKITEPQVDNTHAYRIKVLSSKGLFPKDIVDILDAIRLSRNDAVHKSYESTEKAKILLESTYRLGIWFMQTYGNRNKFELPRDTRGDLDFHAVIGVLEERVNQLTKKIETSPHNRTNGSIANTRIKAKNLVNITNLSKKETPNGQGATKQTNGENEIKIGAFVRSTINKLVQENSIAEDMVSMLCSQGYSKQTFDINYPFFKRVEKDISHSEQRKINGYDRYWTKEQSIHGDEYFLCNDWYERNRIPFIRWVEHIYKLNRLKS